MRMLRQWLSGHEQRTPTGPLPILRLTRAHFDRPPPPGSAPPGWDTPRSWSRSMARILFDPVWARRASPSSLIGPRRFHEPPLPLSELPPLDAVIASHDHYDHLDRGVVRALAASPAWADEARGGMGGVSARISSAGAFPSRATTRSGILRRHGTGASHLPQR